MRKTVSLVLAICGTLLLLLLFATGRLIYTHVYSQDFSDIRFTLLIGGDNWAAFDKWYHHDDILAHYPIVVYPRKGSDIGEVPEGVTIVETPLLNISSTEIRHHIAKGESIHGMVPESIEQLAIQNYSSLIR